MRLCKRNDSANTKVNEEGGERDARDAIAESVPLQPLLKTKMSKAVPLQPMKVHGGADILLHPMEGTHTGAVCEELHPVGRTHVGEVCGELSPVRETPHWSRGIV